MPYDLFNKNAGQRGNQALICEFFRGTYRMTARIRRMRKSPLMIAVLVLGLSASALQAVPVFTLDPPGGAVSGTPGSTVGWGFTLSNNTDWLVVTVSAFCVGTGHTAADLFTAACTTAYAAVGTYTDFIATTFSNTGMSIGEPNPPDPNGGPVCVMPGTSTNCDTPLFVQLFDAMNMTGVGKFDINPAAMPGDSVSGEILVRYDLFTASPNGDFFNPDDPNNMFNQLFVAPASVTVVAEVPEPGTLFSIACGLAGLGFLHLRRRGRL